MKTIIVPVDFSDESLTGLNLALMLANKTGADIAASIKRVPYFIMSTFLLTACDSGQGIMHGGGTSMNMINWNWVLILIGLIIVFLVGYLVTRRRR